VTPASFSARDAGLTRVVGPFALAATVVSLMVGAAIFAVPADLSRTAGSVAAIGGINMAGVAQGARLVGIATVLKLGPLLLFLCAGAALLYLLKTGLARRRRTASLSGSA
jgi:amino acid transporter